MSSAASLDFDNLATRKASFQFRSPCVTRRHLGKDEMLIHSAKNSRRARSTEPSPDNKGTYSKQPCEDKMDVINRFADGLEPDDSCDGISEKRLPFSLKNNENMSKTELINGYRLLMNEKLRLERFLSIMSKNNEMARNRLESDLLDAMMCIEDLKQALELRMARDPREAEERRYLIRQNKKLLNQLYESAKKIERLELTKVEMREQLELLDFQILEVENQKAMMEEELKKLPSCNHMYTQTEEDPAAPSQLVARLQERLNTMEVDLHGRKAEAAAALAKQQHLEHLIRDLRRDNIELRDQLAKLDDTENSLAESDKPLASGVRVNQVAMCKAADAPDLSSLVAPKVDDLLLQETIRAFHNVLAEKEQEMSHLKQVLQSNAQLLGSPDEPPSITLPQLYESAVQTDFVASDSHASSLANALAEGGILLTADQKAKLTKEIRHSLDALNHSVAADTLGDEVSEDAQQVCFGDLLSSVGQLRQKIEGLQMMMSCTDASQPKTTLTQPRLHNGSTLAVGSEHTVPASTQSEDKTPECFEAKFKELREREDYELLEAKLGVSERRRNDLESRLTELAEELTRARAESRSAEVSLSATRRTEAALRRRLLAAMDLQRSQSESVTNRFSLNGAGSAAFDIQNIVELQASLIKTEATNASLTEAAQLDRSRLAEQMMRIGQLEAERRTLIDRISVLQSTEASAQRGIVRLQALYEDMLREYSESRCHEFSWQMRERSRQEHRKADEENQKMSAELAQAESLISQLKEKVSLLEEENLSLKQADRGTPGECTTHSRTVGRCSNPDCIEARRLLRAFQDRFTDVVTQLDRAQLCLNALQMSSDLPPNGDATAAPDSHCSSMITSARHQLASMINSITQYSSCGIDVSDTLALAKSCSNILSYLENWIAAFVKQNDGKLMQLRTAILNLSYAPENGERTTVSTSTNEVKPLFSCLVHVSKKSHSYETSQKGDVHGMHQGLVEPDYLEKVPMSKFSKIDPETA
ncbi:unnamed protein product [Dicrocoelium dendriticum]|nr:unnamed protein product [Dicrocoelium dendriticum]